MEQGENLEIRNPRGILRILVLLASWLVALQTIFLMAKISPASFEGLGDLSTQTVSLILLQIVLLSCIIGIIALASLSSENWTVRLVRRARIVLLLFGVILGVEGVSTIYLSNFIVSGSNQILMGSFGLVLYTLGILSMISYMQNERGLTFRREAQALSAIVFLLLMLPMALVLV
ncbi:MAG TPA: hypothetical protein VMB46_08760 [Methanomassiliicoccales archaeon]|nr:hypothetical protein [Methanomassiliicoccales archaeon]